MATYLVHYKAKREFDDMEGSAFATWKKVTINHIKELEKKIGKELGAEAVVILNIVNLNKL